MTNYELVGWVIGIIVALWGAVTFIDSRISKKLNDPKFLKSIAQLLRPYAIFNGKGIYIVDEGAVAFIDDLEITTVVSDDQDLVTEVLIKLKTYHATAPILTSLSDLECIIKESRGNNYDWRYTIDYTGYSYVPMDVAERRYKLEIVT